MKNLESKINQILERNARVEADKAWETSWARRAIIAVFTYAIIVLLMVNIRDPNPFFDALVPTCAFVISTAALPFAKNWWLEKVYRK